MKKNAASQAVADMKHAVATAERIVLQPLLSAHRSKAAIIQSHWDTFTRRLPTGVLSVAFMEQCVQHFLANITRPDACIQFLQKPPFVNYMASFGDLPGYAYIPTFDPHASQRRLLLLQQPSVPEKKAEKVASLSRHTRSTSSSSSSSSSSLSLRVCNSCGSNMRPMTVQLRAADEQAHDLYRCPNGCA